MTSPERAGSLQRVVRANSGKRVEPVFDDAGDEPVQKQRRVSTSPGRRHVHFDDSSSVRSNGHMRVSVTSASWKTRLFHGLYAAVVTPLTDDGKIAPQEIDAYARHLRRDGVNGVFVCGTAGSSMSLSVAERKVLLSAWVRAGLAHNVQVLAHIGAQSLEDSKELARHAEEVGAAAVSAMAPSFFKPASAKELAEYIREIAAAAPDTPFLYYHFPEITGVDISMKVAMEALHESVPTLRGGKFTSKDMWDLGDTVDLAKSYGVEWDLMMGYEGQTTSALPLGITAHIGIAFSVAGPIWNRCIRAYNAGKHSEANAEQQLGRAWFKLFSDISGLWSMTAATKLMLHDRLTIDFGAMRPPQKGLTPAQAEAVLKAWSAFKRTHLGLFDHPGCLEAPAAPLKISNAGPTNVDVATLPGYLGKLRDEIKERCTEVASKLHIEVKDVLAVLPHLEGVFQRPRRIIANVADAVDHTLLKADASAADVEKLCAEARQHSFYAVCVNSSRVQQAARLLRGSGVGLASVVGFPLGACITAAKVSETREATSHGATEIDMVLNIGALKEGDYPLVFDDIAAVVKGAGSAIVKVIFETCLLSREQIIDASIMCALAGAHFVKTSTGFSKSGATLEVADIMKATVGTACFVKASGGVRDLAAAEAYLELGVSRIGTSSGVAIVTGAKGTTGY